MILSEHFPLQELQLKLLQGKCSMTKPTMQQQVRNPKYKHTPVFMFIILQMVLNTLF